MCMLLQRRVVINLAAGYWPTMIRDPASDESIPETTASDIMTL